MKNERHDWNLCFVLHLRLIWCMLSRRKQLVSLAFFTPSCVVSWSSMMSIYMWTETLLLSSLTATRTKHLSAGQSNSAAIIHSVGARFPPMMFFVEGSGFGQCSGKTLYQKLPVFYTWSCCWIQVYIFTPSCPRSSACRCAPSPTSALLLVIVHCEGDNELCWV